MTSLEGSVAPEDTQSQWVGEATIKGKSQVRPLGMRSLTLDDSAYAVDDMSFGVAVYLYCPVWWRGANCREC
jgi:hypothetical protein